jgi:hypothetical protein
VRFMARDDLCTVSYCAIPRADCYLTQMILENKGYTVNLVNWEHHNDKS